MKRIAKEIKEHLFKASALTVRIFKASALMLLFSVYSYAANQGAITVTFSVLSSPAAPSEFSAINRTATDIEWGWTDNSGNEDGFRIKDEIGGIVTTLPPDTTYYIETGLSVNTSYYRYVEAYNTSGGNSSPGAAVYTLDTLPPSGISLFSITKYAAGNRLILNWTNPVTQDFNGVIIRYRDDGIYPANISDGIQVYNGAASTAAVSALSDHTTYYFSAWAYDSAFNYSTASQVSDYPADTQVPSDIVSLSAVISGTDGVINLAWTATGDSGEEGTAAKYYLRYSLSGEITAGNWASAVEYLQSWTPAGFGVAENFPVSGLTAGATYWFALKVEDESGNISGVSNSPLARAGGAVALSIQTALSQTAGASYGATVTAKNALGNTVSDYTGTIRFSSDDSFAVLPETMTYLLSDNGVKSVSVIFKKAGTRILAAEDTVKSTIAGIQAGINVSPSAPIKLQVLLPGETADPGSVPGKSGTPLVQTAGTEFTVTVNCVDSFWNQTTTNPTVKPFTSDSYDLEPGETSLTAGSGIFAIMFRTAGMQTVTATDSGAAYFSNTGSNITVNPAAPAKLMLVAPGETLAPGSTSGKTGTPVAQSAGISFTVAAFSMDNYWNTISSTETVSINTTDLADTEPVAAALIAGEKQFDITLVTEGSWTITASADSGIYTPFQVSIPVTGDAVPPSTITDLIAVTGANEGEIDISWTAVGDDGLTGTAAGYIVRYSTVSITTDINFDQAGTYFQNWTPVSSLQAENKTLTGLTGGVSYYISIKAGDELNNTGALSNITGNSAAARSDLIPPGNISGLSVTAQNKTIAISWSNPADMDFTGVLVRFRQDDYPANINDGTEAYFGPGSSTVITGLINGLTYYIKIWTYDALSNYSSGLLVSSPVVDTTLPAVPMDISAINRTATIIEWGWTDNADNETGYTVSDSSGNIIANLSVNTTRYIETGFLPNTLYERGIAAFNNNGTGSTVSSFSWTLANPPSALSCISFGDTTVNLEWTEGTNQNTRFAIERSNDGVSWSFIRSWADNHTLASFQDSGLSENTVYYYRVSGYNGDGIITAPTDSVNITTKISGADYTSPGVITDLLASPGSGNGEIVLTWTSPGDDGMTGELTAGSEYRIRYSTFSSGSAAASFTKTLAIGTDIAGPVIPGARMTYTFTDMFPYQEYYFWLKTADEVPNPALYSNSAHNRAMDAVNPAVSITYPASSADLKLKAVSIVSGTASDTGSIVKNVKYSVFLQESNWYWSGSGWSGGELLHDASGTDSWEIDLSSVSFADGKKHIVRVYAYDYFDNYTPAALEFYYDVSLPLSGIISPLTGYDYQNPGTISGTASDNLALSSVELSVLSIADGKYFDGASQWVAGETWLAATGKENFIYSGNVSYQAGAAYRIFSRAKDLAGNYQAVPSSISFNYVLPAVSFRVVIDSSAASGVAGSSMSYTVTALNSAGSQATGYQGTVQFASDNAALFASALYKFLPADGGTRTFTDSISFTRSGANKFSVSDTNIRGESQALEVSPGASSKIIVVLPGEALDRNSINGKSGVPAIQFTNSSFTVTAYAADAYFNIAPSTLTAMLSVRNSGLTPVVSLFTGGTAVFGGVKITQEGTHTVDVTNAENILSTGTATIIISVPPTGFVVTSPLEAYISKDISVTIEVKAGDRKITDYDQTVSFSADDAELAVIPAAYKFTTADRGSRVFAFRFNKLGVKRITATDGTITQDFYVRIKPFDYISGMVLDSALQPIAGVKVYSIAYAGGAAKNADTLNSSTGGFGINGLVPGKHKVYASWEYSGNVSAVMRESETGEENIGFVLSLDFAPATVTGNLAISKAQSTKVASGVINRAIPQFTGKAAKDGQYVELLKDGSVVGRTGLDENGNFEFKNVVPGSYIIRAYNGEVYSQPQAIKLFDGQAMNVSIRYAPMDPAKFYVYPNPARSDLQTWNGKVYFDYYSADNSHTAELKIFTISGELVFDTTDRSSANNSTLNTNKRMEWKLKNNSGQNVASGIYIYIFKASGDGEEVKRGKIAVIR